MFIYCVNESVRDELLLHGYKFIKEARFNNTVAFIFENNIKEKITFSADKVFFSNRLDFGRW